MRTTNYCMCPSWFCWQIHWIFLHRSFIIFNVNDNKLLFILSTLFLSFFSKSLTTHKYNNMNQFTKVFNTVISISNEREGNKIIEKSIVWWRMRKRKAKKKMKHNNRRTNTNIKTNFHILLQWIHNLYAHELFHCV